MDCKTVITEGGRAYTNVICLRLEYKVPTWGVAGAAGSGHTTFLLSRLQPGLCPLAPSLDTAQRPNGHR